MREGEPYIVIERERDGGFGPFILGALVGAGLALLLAPQTGEETQEELKKQARRFRAQAGERVRAVQEELEGRLDQARAGVQSRVEEVRGAVESGREAAREARSDLERCEDQVQRGRTARRGDCVGCLMAFGESFFKGGDFRPLCQPAGQQRFAQCLPFCLAGRRHCDLNCRSFVGHDQVRPAARRRLATSAL